MRSLFVILGLLFLSDKIIAQINFSNYFQSQYKPTVNLHDYLDASFKWDFDGKMQTLVNSGITELSEKRYAKAIAALTEAINTQPKFWLSYYYRGVAYKVSGNFAKATDDFQSASILSAGRAEISIELGEIFQHRRQLEEAQKEYNKAKDFNSLNAEAYYGLGNIAFLKLEKNRASRLYNQCLEANPKFAGAYTMLGLLKLSDNRKAEESLTLFDKALEVDQHCQEALFWRALTYLELDQTEKSIESWNTLIRINPDNNFFILLRGFLYNELKNYDKAFIDFKNSLLNTEVDENNFNLGQTVLNKKIDLQSAAVYLMRNVFGLEDEVATPLKMGFCHILASDLPQAIHDLKVSIQHQPTASAHWLKALSHEYLQQYDSSYVDYDKTLKLDNDIFDAHKKRAIYRSDRKDWKGAVRDFMDMERLQPESIVTWRLRGQLKYNQKDYYGSLLDFTRYLKKDSFNIEVLNTRAQAHMQVKNYTHARNDYRKIITLDSSQTEPREQFYYLSLMLNDTTSAWNALEQYGLDFRGRTFTFLRKAEILIARKQWVNAQEITIAYRKNIFFTDPIADVYMTFLEGRIFAGRDQTKEAIQSFSKAIKKGTEHDYRILEAWYERGFLYWKTGELKKAVKDFEVLKTEGYQSNLDFINTVLDSATKPK